MHPGLFDRSAPAARSVRRLPPARLPFCGYRRWNRFGRDSPLESV